MVNHPWIQQAIISQVMQGTVIIKVGGLLDSRWKDRFYGMEIFHDESHTIIRGHIKDEAFLHGILAIIRDLNLHLISINPADEIGPNN